MRKFSPAFVLSALVLAGAALLVRSARDHRVEVTSITPAAPLPPSTPAPPIADADDDRSYVFRLPSGEPTALTCDEAHLIIDQVRAGLAYEASGVEPKAFASSAADWLDPHGLLSLAPDAPGAAILDEAVPALLASIEGRAGHEACEGTTAAAGRLKAWADELHAAFESGRREGAASKPDPTDVESAVSEAISTSGQGRGVARELGRRVGVFEAATGVDGRAFAEAAEHRFTPELPTDGWERVILAASVRAWVPMVDPHGEWAPFDEEARIYEIDLSSRPPQRLWTQTTSTALGARITEGARAPLAQGDVVLSVAGVPTAGLPLEQLEQLSFAADGSQLGVDAIVWRGGAILTLGIRREAPSKARAEAVEPALPVERVHYGDGDVLVVTVKDVRDDLGDDLGNVISEQRAASGRKLHGVVLDLRGNGGGSTDGAVGALGLFVPGAPLFTLKRRDGTTEIDRAPTARGDERWDGPVATLVDGATASAAEMIAGALAAYRRGPIVGLTTFGKGCAQEYVDDDAHAGVLRLTTLLYALADGTPVQRVGLRPTLRFPFKPSGDPPREREASLPHAAPTWRGPDVRDPAVVVSADAIAWPSHAGGVGPCIHNELCSALELLGRVPPPRWPSAAKRPPVAKH